LETKRTIFFTERAFLNTIIKGTVTFPTAFTPMETFIIKNNIRFINNSKFVILASLVIDRNWIKIECSNIKRNFTFTWFNFKSIVYLFSFKIFFIMFLVTCLKIYVIYKYINICINVPKYIYILNK